MRELSQELDEYRHSFPDLEDKILGLQAETESQDKALRSYELQCPKAYLQICVLSQDSDQPMH